MGKKRTVQKRGGGYNPELRTRSLSKGVKKRVGSGRLYIHSTYNNTKVVLTDNGGDVLAWSSSGHLGFKGTKKGTPFAAARAGDLVGEKAKLMGMGEVAVIIRGVGSGRESSLRSFASKGVNISVIRDETPVPFNGPRPRKARRV